MNMKTTLLSSWYRSVALCLLALAVLAASLQGADTMPPERMTFQGFLVDANGNALATNAPKNYDVIFRIYNDQSSSTKIWTEQQTVTVDKGYFSVVLGEGAAFGGEARPMLSTIFTNVDSSDRYVEMTVKGIGPGSPPADVAILPRLRLVSSPYAFVARNALNAVNAANLVSTNYATIVSLSGTNVGINKANPTSALDVGGNINARSLTVSNATVQNSLNVSGTTTATAFVGFGTIPVGGIIMWSGVTPPAGWALCDGNNNTPDLRGRFVLGYGSGPGLTPRNTIKATGGEEMHTLTIPEMPNHSHPWLFGLEGDDQGGGGSYAEHTRVPGTLYDNIGYVGGGAAHNNMPPFYVLAFIIRVQ